jgi:hypothetical protein
MASAGRENTKRSDVRMSEQDDDDDDEQQHRDEDQTDN